MDESQKNLLDFTNENDTLDGFQGIDNDTMAIPFVRVLQPGSPQAKKEEKTFIEGAEPGLFLNTVTKKLYKAITVIVLQFEHIILEWKPRATGGGLVGRHTYEYGMKLATDTTQFGKWKTRDGNELQENYVYAALVCGEEKNGIVCLSFPSTFIKTAKEWNRLLVTHIISEGKLKGQRAKPFYLKWDISTEYVSKPPYSWYIPKVRFAGYIDQLQYGVVEPERKALPSLKIDFAQLEATPEDEKGADISAETKF